MILIYNIKIFEPSPRGWLRHEEFFLDPTNAVNSVKGEKFYVLTMYEVKEPLNPVALLNRTNCFLRFEVIEDTRGRGELRGTYGDTI